MKFVDKLADSLHNQPGGFSFRKLASMVGVVTSVIITFRFCDEKVLVQVVCVWLLFSLLCVGIITFQDIIKFKTGTVTTTTSESEKVKVTEEIKVPNQ